MFAGWVFAHFKQLVQRKRDKDYMRADPHVGKWKPHMVFFDHGHFRSAIDLTEHHNVIGRPYETRRDLTPFQDICWYSRWIMAGEDRMCTHLPERILRQYNYVQTIPIPPTTIVDLEPAEVVMAFMEFVVHVLSQQKRGGLVSEDDVCKQSKGYMKLFYKVSHPIMIALQPFQTTQLMSLPTRRLLLSSSGSDSLLTHLRSSATSEPEWRVQWGS